MPTLTPAQAFLNHGALNQWTGPTAGPLTGLGITMKEGSWPVWPAYGPEWDAYVAELAKSKKKAQRPFVRNPAFLDETARWTGVFKPRKIYHDWLDWLRGIEAANVEVGMPWPKGATGAGGTQAKSSDNGCIIDLGDGRYYEIQGMAQDGARWRADGLVKVEPGVRIQGSQGPWPKTDGLLRPSWLDGTPWPGPMRLVVFNVQYGPGAVPATPEARVEHPKVTQLDEWIRKILPAGDDPRCLRPGQPLKYLTTEDSREQWLDDERIPDGPLRDSKRNFAIGLNDEGAQVRERGTGSPIGECSGGVEPGDRARFAARGLVTAADYRDLGSNLFKPKYGEMVAA